MVDAAAPTREPRAAPGPTPDRHAAPTLDGASVLDGDGSVGPLRLAAGRDSAGWLAPLPSPALRRQALLAAQRAVGNATVQRTIGVGTGRQPAAAHRRPVLQRDRFWRDDPPSGGTPADTPDTPQAKQKRLAALRDKVKAMVKAGRDAGYDLAADNLQYWFDGKGGERRIPSTHFAGEPFILEWLRGRPLEKFKEGAKRRVGEGQVSFEMTWKDSIYSPVGHKLLYALGGFTVLSKVTARAEKLAPADGQVWIVKLENWTCSATDDYNWDPGKHTFIPGFGDVPDEDLRLLEANGNGKSYLIQSDPWVVRDFALSGFDFPY